MNINFHPTKLVSTRHNTKGMSELNQIYLSSTIKHRRGFAVSETVVELIDD